MKKLFLTLTLGLFVVPFGISQDLPSNIPTNGLVAYYPFDGNANDESGNGNHGTVNGATLSSNRNDDDNSAYDFQVLDWDAGNNGGDYIYIPHSSEFNFESFTLSAWVYRKSAGASNSPQHLTIMRKFEEGYNNPNGESWHFDIAHGTDNGGSILIGRVIEQSPSPATKFECASTNILIEKEWTNVIMTYSDKTIKTFINGVESCSSTNNNITLNTLGTSGISIGMSVQANGNWGPFDGSIDDIGIWNRALTEQEIQNLYTSSTGDIILNGVVSAEDNQIKNVADPTDAQDAVTKTYLEGIISALESRIEQLENNQDDGSEQNIPSNVPLNGLLAYYPLDGNGQDKTEFQNHMNMVGQITYTTDDEGGQNKAANFTNSLNGYFELPVSSWSHLNALSNGSLSFWIKLDQKFVSNHYFGFGNSFMVKQKHGQGQDFFIGLSDDTTNVMVYLSGVFPQSSSNYIVGNSSLALDTWYNIVVTWNGSDQKLYVNGNLDGELIAEYDGISDRTDIDFFSIGSATYGTNTSTSERDAGAYGSMDNIAFWNRELSSEEVNSLYIGN